PIISPLGVRYKSYINLEGNVDLERDSINIYNSEHLVNNLFSEDAGSVSIFFENDTGLTKPQTDSLLAHIDRITASSIIGESHLAGKIYGQSYYIDYMVKEFAFFLLCSVLLLIIFVTIAFRSFSAIILSITVVLFTIVWLLGIMAISGKAINLFTTVLPTIIFVVGISDVVHILEKYIEELRKGSTKIDSLKITIKEIGRATLMTSITTAVGFGTLLTAGIQPVRDLGLYSAIGVFIAFLLTMSILPAALYLLPAPKIALTGKKAVGFWENILRKLFIAILKQRKIVLIIWVLLLSISGLLIMNIKVDNYLLEDFKDDNPLKKSYSFFEDNFSGFRSFEIDAQLINDSDSIFTLESLREIESVELYLKENYDCNFVLSPVSLIKGTRMASRGGLIKHYKLPESNKELKSLVRKINSADDQLVSKILADDGRSARISCKIEDFGGHTLMLKNKEFDKFLADRAQNANFKYTVTGFASLIDKNNQYLAKNMLGGLLIAFCSVALLMALLYRSPIMLIIAIIPNIVPLILVAGVMGAFSIDLKVATSIIFTIAFGIAVDDSIHFLSRYKLELQKGRSRLYALKRTYLSTGKAIIVTSLILSTGFLSLVSAEMTGTHYIGLLISICLMFAVLSDLLLLPIVILFMRTKTESRNEN
ncbi:MAG: MMPL family transporter, partial [Bacteroidia bacterium]|nr:MMPL family transporter [Bacteroidia bacterium]